MPSCQVAVVLGMAVSLVDGARTQMVRGHGQAFGARRQLLRCASTAETLIRWVGLSGRGGHARYDRAARLSTWTSIQGGHLSRAPMVLSMGPAATRQVRLCVTISTCASSPQLRIPAQCGISCLHYWSDCQSVGLVYQPSFALEIPHFLRHHFTLHLGPCQVRFCVMSRKILIGI